MKIQENIQEDVIEELIKIRDAVNKPEFGIGQVLRKGIRPNLITGYICLYGENYAKFTEILDNLVIEIKVLTRIELGRMLSTLFSQILDDSPKEARGKVLNFFENIEKIKQEQWTIYAPLKAELNVDFKIGEVTLHPPNEEMWDTISAKIGPYNETSINEIKRFPYINVKVKAFTANQATSRGVDKIESYLNFIRLFTKERVEITSYYFTTKDGVPYYSRFFTPGYPKLHLTTPQEKSEIEKLIENNNGLIPLIEESDTMTELEKRIYKAIKWFGKGQNERDDLIRFVNYVTVGEILTNVDGSGVSKRFRETIGKIVSASDKNYPKFRQIAKKLYKKRCDILHAGGSNITSEEVLTMEHYARILISFFGKNKDKAETLKDFEKIVKKDFDSLRISEP